MTKKKDEVKPFAGYTTAKKTKKPPAPTPAVAEHGVNEIKEPVAEIPVEHRRGRVAL